MAELSLEDMLKQVADHIQEREAKLNRDFDDTVDAVHDTCAKLSEQKVPLEVVMAGLIVGAAELSCIVKGGQRGKARDMLSEMLDKALNDLERLAQKNGLDKALAKAADLAQKGDHEGALRVAEEFGASDGKV